MLLDELTTFNDVHEGWEQHSHASSAFIVNLQDVPMSEEAYIESFTRHSTNNAQEEARDRDGALGDGILPTPMDLYLDLVLGYLVARRTMVSSMSFWTKMELKLVESMGKVLRSTSQVFSI